MYPANGALHNRASNDEGVQQIRKKPSMQIRLSTPKNSLQNVWWISFNLHYILYTLIHVFIHVMFALVWGVFPLGSWGMDKKYWHPSTHTCIVGNKFMASFPCTSAQVILLPITCKPPHYVLREVLTLVWEECLVKWTLKIVEVTCKSNYVENLRVHRAWSVPPQTSPKIQTCDGRTFRVPRQTYG